MNPIWWTEHQAAIMGAVGGTLVGLLGALAGVLMGVFARRGKFKGLVIGLLSAGVVAGVVLLGVAAVALLARQPYHVWYPPAIGGAVLPVVCGVLIPVALRVYREAEHRRMEARAILRA